MTTTATTTSAEPAQRFTARLRDETMEAHRDAERSRFVGALMRGELDRDAIADLAAQHHAIYRALEATGERWSADPVVAALVTPGLSRIGALESDLSTLLGESWRARVETTGATDEYVARIEQVGGVDASRYVAHHYIRLLGDLSGGQIIRRTLGRHYGLDEAATSFYDFSAAGHAGELKVAYRATLDDAPWDDATRDGVIAEVSLAYRLNSAVFESLAERHC